MQQVDWWAALARAGVGIHEQAGQWYAHCTTFPDGKLGPFASAEDAITGGIGYLHALAVDRRVRGDDVPPEPFRKLLG